MSGGAPVYSLASAGNRYGLVDYQVEQARDATIAAKASASDITAAVSAEALARAVVDGTLWTALAGKADASALADKLSKSETGTQTVAGPVRFNSAVDFAPGVWNTVAGGSGLAVYFVPGGTYFASNVHFSNYALDQIGSITVGSGGISTTGNVTAANISTNGLVYAGTYLQSPFAYLGHVRTDTFEVKSGNGATTFATFNATGISTTGTVTAAGVPIGGSTGTNAIAIGQGAVATDAPSGRGGGVALGTNSLASGFSVAVGGGAVAGEQGTAIGYGATNSGGLGIAIGQGTSAGPFSLAAGFGPSASGVSVALGYLASSLNDGVAIGRSAIASDGGTAIGSGATAATAEIAISAANQPYYLKFDSTKNATFAGSVSITNALMVGGALNTSNIRAASGTDLSLRRDDGTDVLVIPSGNVPIAKYGFRTTQLNIGTGGVQAFDVINGGSIPLYLTTAANLSPIVLGASSTPLNGPVLDNALATFHRHQSTPATFGSVAGAWLYVDVVDGLPKFKGPDGVVHTFTLS